MPFGARIFPMSRRGRLYSSLAIIVCATFYRYFYYSFHPPEKIGGLILEYEDFSNDLPQTLRSVSHIFSSIAVYNEDFIYPPMLDDDVKNLTSSLEKFKIFEYNRDIRQGFSDLNIEDFYSDINYMLVFPDGIRPVEDFDSKDVIRSYVEKMQSDGIDAVVLPVFVKECQTKCGFVAKPQCVPFRFDVKHWTILQTSDKDSDLKNDCDYQYEPGFVVLIKKRMFFNIHKPFLRPFMHSFAIQSHALRMHVVYITRILFHLPKPVISAKRLREKKKALDDHRRRRIYYELGVKLIQGREPDQQKWFGCDRDHSRCFATVHNDQPDYLFQKRFLPPCCRRNLEITGKYVLKLLTTSGIRYWLEGGSLLGAARNGQIIPWDYDIDIGFYREDFVKLGPSLSVLLTSPPGTQIQDGQNFVWEKAVEGDFIRVHYSRINRIHVDLFPFYSSNGNMTKDTWLEGHPQDCAFPEHFLHPLTTINFLGMEASAPNNIKDFLEFKFGEGVIDNAQLPGNFTVEDFK